MQYWHKNLTRLYDDPDVKRTSQCIADTTTTDRVCFDRIGTPVLQFAIFGGLGCTEPRKNECSQCAVTASGLQTTFLLYNNAYSSPTAAQWEKDVFIRNLKSFNKAMDNDYHTEMTLYDDDDNNYNEDLIAKIQNVTKTYKDLGIDLVPVKADYLAERSIPDNIQQETDENTSVAVISYCLMFVYVGCALGHLPSLVHSKFALGFAGILVIVAALISSIGLTFYFD